MRGPWMERRATPRFMPEPHIDSDHTTKPSICFHGLYNLPILAREFGAHGAGGAQVQQTLLARALVHRGYKISMVVADYGQPDGASWDGIATYKTFRDDEGIPILRFVHPRLTRMWAAMRRADADIYYVSCAGMHVAAAVLFGRAYGRKVIFRVASDSDCDPEKLLVPMWRDRKLYAYGLKRVDAVLAQTPTQQQALLRNYKRTSGLAPSLADLTGSPHGFSDRDIAVLWVNNIQQLKRPDLLIDLAQRMPRLPFHIVGGALPGYSSLYNDIRQRAATLPNVTFHGSVSYHAVNDFYARARVVVNTSEIEGFPNSYLQAWAHGAPVVAFHDPGGVIAREGLGTAAKTNEEMSTAIGELATDAQRWQTTSNRCKAFMARDFGEENTLVKYLEVIDSVAAAGKSG
jgi:glycosyltransferase involved in cell wall biosynthesis